jgi:hypothetical protein
MTSSSSDSLFPISSKPLKIVVFDLDETLGYFVEFGTFWNAIEAYKNTKLTQDDFNATLDLFPEFIRPNILSVLKFLKIKKKCKKCSHLMIYTNNQGPKEWAIFIKKYFESKMKSNIFDRIIAAFKINGKQVEFCRTTHNKTHNDFIKCTKVPKNSQICFLDDVYHPDMKNDNVYYINIHPYVHDLPFQEMIDRYINAGFIDIEDQEDFNNFVINYVKKYNHTFIKKDMDEYEIDKILTKQILHHMQIFFNKDIGNSITRKSKKYNNITLKNGR